MGIQGLMSYVLSEEQFFKEVQLRNTKIIIDGNNLYYKLYFDSGLDQRHGGNYDSFTEFVHKFFESLALCGIHAYVVLDGGCDINDKKLETQKERSVDKIQMAHNLSKGGQGNVLPLLVREVFIQVLRKMQVPLVQSFSEADREIVVLANRWNCPVLTFDSDFCIFDLKAGYCPMNCFHWKNIVTPKGSQECYIQARCFSAQMFCRYFNNMSMSLLPLFAVLCGNDYINLPALETFFRQVHLPVRTSCHSGRKHVRIYGMLNWLSAFANVDEAMDNVLKYFRLKARDNIKELLYSAMEEYNLSETANLESFFQKGSCVWSTAVQLKLPDWVQGTLARGQLSPFLSDALVLRRTFLHAQVEDSRRPSAHLVTKPIRQVIYGLLLNSFCNFEETTTKQSSKPVVVEFERLETTLRKVRVEAFVSKCFLEDLSLHNLHEVPLETRLKVLTDTLEVEESILETLPPVHHLTLAVTRYWFNHADPRVKMHHLRALILGIVFGDICKKMNKPELEDKSEIRLVYEELEKMKLGHPHPRRPDLEDLHVFCQWQCCLQTGLNLNKLLSAPLPEPDLSSLYKGTLVHLLCQKLKSSSFAEELLNPFRPLQKLYQDFIHAVTSTKSPDNCEARPVSRKSKKKKKKRTVRNMKEDAVLKNQPLCEVHNKFAQLDLED